MNHLETENFLGCFITGLVRGYFLLREVVSAIPSVRIGYNSLLVISGSLSSCSGGGGVGYGFSCLPC
ncbi:hypothetical protein [Chlamydia felis Fe/C-56]|uniref:Uncharacterized protein n=1 Tax=Chlamydia felis (strain Fe/C-56) TaxID=264202 RepID=Q254S2_CHLFF|nr:hypothetical protein [Chlamydia felis Fe/C-56]